MSDPVCTEEMHYFRKPVSAGEACQCGKVSYEFPVAATPAEDDESEPLSGISNPLSPLWNTPDIPDTPSIDPDPMPTVDPPDFGGGSSGGGGASGDW